MRKLTLSILASAAAFAFAVPASAQSCTSGTPALFLNDTTPSPINCAGYYAGNIFSSNAGDLATINSGLQTLSPGFPVVTSLASFASLINIGGSNTGTFLDFGTGALFGNIILGVHTGGSQNGGTPTGNFIGNQSALYLINFTGQTGIQLNLPAASNAYLFRGRGGAVPEPSTWAMMLVGFGAVGYGMRNRRRATLQAA